MSSRATTLGGFIALLFCVMAFGCETPPPPECARPEAGCACPVGAWQPCYPDAVGDEDGRTCFLGTRHCRGGAWSGCESVDSYHEDGEFGSVSSYLVTGPDTCTSCNPACVISTDYPDNSDLTPRNSNDVEYSPEEGGLVLEDDGTSTPPPPRPPGGCDLYFVLPRGQSPQTGVVETRLRRDARATRVDLTDIASTAVDERAFLDSVAATRCPFARCSLGAVDDECHGCAADAEIGFSLTFVNNIVPATAEDQRFEFDVVVLADDAEAAESHVCIDIPAIAGPDECVGIGLSCATDAGCCSGVCTNAPGRSFKICGALGGTCFSDGAACALSADCCEGACVAGACDASTHCVSYEGACRFDVDCCSNDCTAGHCTYPSVTSCLGGRAACTTDIECCSGNCKSNGSCQNGSTGSPVCLATGESCRDADDCCSGSCNDAGFCARLSFCRGDGEPCGDDAQCCGLACTGGYCENEVDECLPRYSLCSRGSQCCGLRCDDDGSGVDRCLPLGGCAVSGPTPSNPFGESCRGDEYCCSGQCEPDASGDDRCLVARATGCSSSATVPGGEQCNNDCQCDSGACDHVASGRTHQRCSAGLASGVCLVAGDECSIPEDCCDGTCEFHPEGVWRCGPPGTVSGGGLAPSGSYAQDYDASDGCEIPPDRPDWGELSWSAVVPDGTRLAFEIRTASSSRLLNDATPVIVEVSSVRSPVDVGALLLSAGLAHRDIFLRVTVVLYASADLSTSPIMNGFELEYQCVPSE